MQPSDQTLLSLTPGLPPYAQARAYLKAMQGVSYKLYRRMYDQIWKQVGGSRKSAASLKASSVSFWIGKRVRGLAWEMHTQEVHGEIDIQ